MDLCNFVNNLILFLIYFIFSKFVLFSKTKNKVKTKKTKNKVKTTNTCLLSKDRSVV